MNTLNGLPERHKQSIKQPLDQVIDDASDWLTIHCDTVNFLLTERDERDRERERGREREREGEGEGESETQKEIERQRER